MIHQTMDFNKIYSTKHIFPFGVDLKSSLRSFFPTDRQLYHYCTSGHILPGKMAYIGFYWICKLMPDLPSITTSYTIKYSKQGKVFRSFLDLS